jgi:hypothetical protein
MASSSFFIRRPLFIQRPADALRHVDLLAKGLKKVALVGLVGGGACGAMAVLLGRFLLTYSSNPDNSSGFQGMSGVTFVAWFMAVALITFSCLYLIAGWGLSHKKTWARYTAGVVFTVKVLLCIWLGRGSLGAMIVFLLIAGLDLYGLWVLLSKETGHVFSSLETSQPGAKPANLVT